MTEPNLRIECGNCGSTWLVEKRYENTVIMAKLAVCPLCAEKEEEVQKIE